MTDSSLWKVLWNKVQLVYFDSEFHFNPSALKRNVLVWILTTICFPFATFWFRYYLPWSFHIVPRPWSSILMTSPIVHFSVMNNNAVIQSQKQNLKLIFDWLFATNFHIFELRCSKNRFQKNFGNLNRKLYRKKRTLLNPV